MDNFFSSEKLFDDLMEHDIYAAGTIRVNKIAALPELTNKDVQKGMKRGDYLYRSKGNKVVTVWLDKKFIYFLSNVHPAEGDISVGRKRKEDGVVESISCPLVLPACNKYMGGVDCNDQTMP